MKLVNIFLLGLEFLIVLTVGICVFVLGIRAMEKLFSSIERCFPSKRKQLFIKSAASLFLFVCSGFVMSINLLIGLAVAGVFLFTFPEEWIEGPVDWLVKRLRRE